MTDNNSGGSSRALRLDEIVFEEAVQKYGSKNAVEDKWLREYSKLGRNSSYDQAKLVLSELFNLLDIAAEITIREFESTAALIDSSPRENNPNATDYEFEKDGTTYKYYKPNGRLGFGQRMAVLRALGYRIPAALFEEPVTRRNATHHGTATVVKDHLPLGEAEFDLSFDNIADVLIELGRLDPSLKHPTFEQMCITEGRELQSGEYKVGKLIAENEMCRVFEGLQTRFERRVAIKELRPGRYKSNMIERECGILKDIKSQTIAGVNDTFSENGTDYIVMEYVRGTPLYKLSPEDMSFDMMLETVIKLCAAVEYLHSDGRNVRYSVISPQSVIISRNGDPVLTDCGIFHTKHSFTDDTKAYAAPEYLSVKEYGAAQDIYSLGKVMEYLYGFSQTHSESKARNAEFERIMRKASRERPEERFKSPERMLEELNRLYSASSASGRKEQLPGMRELQMKKNTMRLAAVTAALLFAAVLLLVLWSMKGKGRTENAAGAKPYELADNCGLNI